MTTWGALVNGRLKAGLDMSYSPSVGSGTASVTVSWTLRGYSTYASYESGTGVTDWAISGSKTQSGSMNGWNVGAGGTWVVASGTFTVNTSYTSAVTVTLNANYTSGGAYPGYKPTVSMSITIPKRPYTVPSAPSSVGSARVSDTQHTISWTRNATTGAPYDNVYVERWDNVSNAYSLIATLAGTATSYSNTNTVADRQYRWRVRARNSAGYSGYNYSGYLKTTPKASATPTATKDASGNIVVTWSGISSIADSQEIWHAANGVWDAAALSTSLSGTATTYTHAAPNNTQTHSYRVRSKTTSPALTGAYSGTSNVVQLLAAPNAPTSLSPSGVARDATVALPVTWKHNPVDTTAQTKYEIQYRVDGGAWVSLGAVTSATQGATIPANTWTNGHSVEWQVRTWGSYATASPWSTSATITTSSAPTATVNFPDGVNPVDTANLTVEWGYFDAEGTAQSAWSVVLKDNSGNTLETKNGSGTDTSVALATALQDTKTYNVTVTVTDSAGMQSDPATVTFTVAYARPPVPQVTAEWMEETGSVTLEVTIPAPGPARTNLLANPSFEANVDAAPNDWAAARGTITAVQSTDAISGQNVMEYRSTDASSNGGNYFYDLTYMPVTAGLQYNISMYLKPDAPETLAADGGLYAKVWVQWYNGSTFVSTDTMPQATVQNGEWVRLDWTATCPASGVTAVRAFGVVDGIASAGGLVAGDGFFVDATMLEQTNLVGDYIEGTVTETDADYLRVWRRDGDKWRLVADHIAQGVTTIDRIPPLNSTVEYRAESVSLVPSVRMGESVSVATPCKRLNRFWLNAGADFSQGVFLSPNGDINAAGSREKTLQRFAGRDYPTSFSGKGKSKSFGVKGIIVRDNDNERTATSTYDEIEDLILEYDDPFCLRDLRGHRWFVSANDPSWDGPHKQLQSVEFSCDVIDWEEPIYGESL